MGARGGGPGAAPRGGRGSGGEGKEGPSGGGRRRRRREAPGEGVRAGRARALTPAPRQGEGAPELGFGFAVSGKPAWAPLEPFYVAL